MARNEKSYDEVDCTQGAGRSDSFQLPRQTVKRVKVEITMRKAEEKIENKNRYTILDKEEIEMEKNKEEEKEKKKKWRKVKLQRR